MAHADFVHLHIHSAYSLSEGAILLAELVKLCATERMPAVAVTDTGNLFGALEFSEAAAKAGVQPIVGCQLFVARPDQPQGGIVTVPNGAAAQPAGREAPADELVLLVQDEAGYLNLSALSSKAFVETPAGIAPRVTMDDLARHSGGLIALTGGPRGLIGRLLADGQLQAAREMLERLEAAFPGRLYVELMRHGLEAESRIEGDLIDLAYERDLPLVATNDVYFARKEMYEAHDALICIADSTHVAEDRRRRFTPDHRFRTAAEMRALFADLPEAVDNTLSIARRCAFRPLPRKEILPAFPVPDGKTEADALAEAARTGLERRLAAHVFTDEMDQAAREAAAAPYRERLAFELDVIVKMGFPGYFMIVAEFIQWAKEHGIPVGPGRGSGAGSVVAWALTITDLDPLRFGLLFERFLNPDRVSMPDFDVDFCQDRRDEVIAHVQSLYGRDRVAQIITFGKLQARAALRDVGRVLGMPYGQVDRISKMVPYNPAHPPTLEDALKAEPRLRQMRDEDETVAKLIDIAMKLEGLYRHASTHAAGVVIGDRPLERLLPLYRDPRSEMIATQFSMKYTEMAGLVKFDFLGLKTLTVLARTVEHLAKRGIEIDLARIPFSDPKTFEMLGRGEATGVFQMESAGMRDVLRQMRPDKFEDLIALVALYRPGPMENIPKYIAVKNGREEADYLHPVLEPVLRETCGVMIYQEQVMRVAQDLAGFSLAKADLMRRAMGKKIKAEMDALRQEFIDGAVANGVEAHRAATIFEQVDKFAGYGFNKSHAAAYALVAWQTAWLKANYPVEFLAATMTYDMGSTDKLNLFRQELARLGIRLLPPDINRSEAEFAVEDGAVRYALAAIKNVGSHAMESLVAERIANGPFADLSDFVARVDSRVANKRQLENLIRAGAFDSLDANRKRLFEGADVLVRLAGSAAGGRDASQPSLFAGEDGAAARPRLNLPETGDWPALERLAQEFEAIGFYLSAHPLDAYGKSLARIGVVPSGAIAERMAGAEARRLKLAGVMVRKQERTSSRGNRFAYVQLSDADGVFEVLIFAELLGAARDRLESNTPLLLTVEARAEGEEIKLTGQAIEVLDAAVANAVAGLRVHLADPAPLDTLREVFAHGRRGRGRVSLVLALDQGREVEIALPEAYAISADIRARISALPGVTVADI
jgi:DNA polymerase III subunit alpha